MSARDSLSDHPLRFAIGTMIPICGLILTTVALVHTRNHDDQVRNDTKANQQKVAKTEKQKAADEAAQVAATARKNEFEHALDSLTDASSTQARRETAIASLARAVTEDPSYARQAVLALQSALHDWSPAADPPPPFTQAVPHEVHVAAGTLRTILKKVNPTSDNPQYKLSTERIDLHGQSWGSMRLPRAYAVGMDLRGANMQYARLMGATLTGTTFACANLEDAHLSGAHVLDVVFTGANLAGADLRVSGQLLPEQIQGAYWDEETVWAGSPPQGMVPNEYRPTHCERQLDRSALLGQQSPPPNPTVQESGTPSPAAN